MGDVARRQWMAPDVDVGNEVDTRVSAPPAGPLIPQPDPAKFMLVDRVVGQEPLADVLELLALDAVVGVESVADSRRAGARRIGRATTSALSEPTSDVAERVCGTCRGDT